MDNKGKWFYTGHMMSDGKTHRTVYIEGTENIEVATDKGLKPVEVKKVVKTRTRKEKP